MMTIMESAIATTLEKIRHPRFFENERGFQGEFRTVLKSEIGSQMDPDAIIEDEHQKRLMDHGLNLRPDLVLHIPFDIATNPSRRTGNFVVFALKREANEGAAIQDFEKLNRMVKLLDYSLAVFININSAQTFFEKCNVPNRLKIVSFAVTRLSDKNSVVKN